MTSSATEPVGESILRRGTPEYETSRRALWNRAVPDRYPQYILQARTDNEVIGGITFARERGLRVAVRGGGHNWFGSSVRDGGLLIDLGKMRDVQVDGAAREAVVQPAVTGRELLRRLEPFRLSFPVGHCPNVPLTGFLLNGGFGWNSLAWGPACFSVRSVDMVTPEGRLVTASAEENAELFWAARGAGPGFFGAILRFRIGLFTRPSAIYTSTCLFPMARLREAAAWAGQLRAQLPPRAELTILVGTIPPVLTADEPALAKSVVVTATAFSDTEEDARKVLAPLASPPTVVDCRRRLLLESTPYDSLLDLMAELWPEDHRYRADNIWTNEPPSSALPPIGALAAEAPSRSFFLCLPLPPPNPTAPPFPDAAFSMVGPTFVACYAVWSDAEQDATCRAWYARAVQTLEPSAIGHYVGETDIERNPTRASRSFAPAAWKRLAALRQKYDPSRIFHGYYGES
jgi:FAD/FMN-containing dehydrogenase